MIKKQKTLKYEDDMHARKNENYFLQNSCVHKLRKH